MKNLRLQRLGSYYRAYLDVLKYSTRHDFEIMKSLFGGPIFMSNNGVTFEVYSVEESCLRISNIYREMLE